MRVNRTIYILYYCIKQGEYCSALKKKNSFQCVLGLYKTYSSIQTSQTYYYVPVTRLEKCVFHTYMKIYLNKR